MPEVTETPENRICSRVVRRIASLRRDRSGSIAILFAIAIIPVIMILGMSIDYGRALGVRSQLQDGLDAAVLAAAGADAGVRKAMANDYFAAYASKMSGYNPEATFDFGASDAVTATATAAVPTNFAGILNINAIPLRVTSSVAIGGGAKACVLILDPTASDALRVNSGADITAPDCEMHIRSNASRAATFNNASGLKFSRICVRGSGATQNGGHVEGLELSCDAASDPYAGTLAPPPSTSCEYNNLNVNGGSTNLTPGVYCGWVNFNSGPTVNFAPGVYVIRNGGWNVNGGKWRGDGVTFYFDDTSKIQFNSSVDVQMTPPTSGTYSGLMMYERAGLSQSDFIFNNAEKFEVAGLMYLPSRNVTYNSGSKTVSDGLTMVFNRLTINQTHWELAPAGNAIAAGGGSGGGVARITE